MLRKWPTDTLLANLCAIWEDFSTGGAWGRIKRHNPMKAYVHGRMWNELFDRVTISVLETNAGAVILDPSIDYEGLVFQAGADECFVTHQMGGSFNMYDESWNNTDCLVCCGRGHGKPKVKALYDTGEPQDIDSDKPLAPVISSHPVCLDCAKALVKKYTR